MKGYTYMVECSDRTLYTGWTNDLKKRLAAHNAGIASKYTRARRPVVLVYYEEFLTKEEAMKREYAIKQLSAGQKRKLLDLPQNLLHTNSPRVDLPHADQTPATRPNS